MRTIKFNKALCGVDFLLNVILVESGDTNQLYDEVHAADFFQIVFINQAEGELILNDQTISLCENQVLFISQNQKCQWKINHQNFNATFLVFQEDFLNEYFSDQYFTYRLHYFYQTEHPLSIDLEEQDKLYYLNQLQEIKKELIDPKTDSVHLIRSMLYYLLAKLNRIYSEKYQISISDMNEVQAFQFRKLVEEHIKTKQRVDDYADLMKVSRITLNKIVKNQFNRTASDFIKSRIVHNIKMELIYSNKSIDQLAMDFNFSESNHFSRFFKKQTGVTATDYRVNYQNGSF